MCTIGSRHRQPGFTLVEIVVVLVIMTVLLTMTVVSLSGGTAGVAARESAAQLLTAMRYARYYAAVHGCQSRVTFKRESHSYELTYQPDPDQDEFQAIPGAKNAVLDSHVHFASVVIVSRQTDNQNPDVITFDPTGQCDAAQIEVTDDRIVYTVTVSPYAGLIRLHKGAAQEIPNDREDLGA
jgi:type II secretion system protein H